MKEWIQVRVSGVAELVEDMDLKKEIVAKHDFMKPVVAARGYDIIAMYRIKKAKAAVWTFPTNFEPKTYVEI
jgi:uncharacterized pyridoxamine 5'-phosphate oxidase family protein